MNTFNRMMAVLLWLALLCLAVYLAIFSLDALAQIQRWLETFSQWLAAQQAQTPTNFLIAQIAFGVVSAVILSLLLWLEIRPSRPRGVRIRTREGAAELETTSIARRLAWHLDQLADVITVIPTVKARGESVDITLEIETAPDIDVAMKSDEVVEVTRDLVEQDMGLKLGKLDVRLRHAPFEPEWVS